MEMYDIYKRERVEMPKKVYDFLEEIEIVCRKYGFSISHQDGNGAFEIELFDKYKMGWLWEANKAYKDD